MKIKNLTTFKIIICCTIFLFLDFLIFDIFIKSSEEKNLIVRRIRTTEHYINIKTGLFYVSHDLRGYFAIVKASLLLIAEHIEESSRLSPEDVDDFNKVSNKTIDIIEQWVSLVEDAKDGKIEVVRVRKLAEKTNGNIDDLEEVLKKIAGDDFNEAIKVIGRQIPKIKEMIKELSLGAVIIRKRAVNLGKFLEKMAGGRNIELVLPEYEILAVIDQNQLSRVIENLVKNSADQMPIERGKIVIKLEKENGNIVIEVMDKAGGISEEKVEIFNRGGVVESSKPGDEKGKKHGWGLRVVQMIIRAHGGEVTCDITEGVGTTVIMVLS